MPSTKERPSLTKAAKNVTNKNAPPPAPAPAPAKPPQPARVEWIPIDRIDRDGQQNHRLETPTSKAKIRSLADDFARGGPAAQLQPVRLYERPSLPYLLGFGFRRVAAAELAGWREVRAEILPMPPDVAEVERVRAVENLQRDDLTPVEEMMALLAYVEALPTHMSLTGRPDDYQSTRDDDGRLQAWAVEHVARAVGRDARWVRDRLYLDRLGPKARRRLVEGKLLVGHAREIAKLGDHGVQEDLARFCEVRADGSCHTSIEQLRRMVEQHQRSLKVVPWLLDATFDGVKDRRILGACATCPHNSSNDRKLFEHDERPDAQDGFCLHDACFEAKTQVSNKAVEKAVSLIVRKDLPATEASATGVVADYVKPGRVAREAKKAKDAPVEGKAAGEQGGEEEPAETRDPTPEEQARADLAAATEKWIQESGDAIHEATLADPMKLAAVLLLEHFVDASWNLSDEDVTGKYREAFDLLAQGDVEGVRGLAKLLAGGDPDVMILGDLPEAAVDLLVRSWKLPVVPRPTLADFMPKPPAAAEEAGEEEDEGGGELRIGWGDTPLGEGKYRDFPAGRYPCVVLGTVTCRGVECARLAPVVDFARWQGETYFGGAARARVAAGTFDGIQVKVRRAVVVIDEPRWTLHVRVGKGGAS